MNLQVFKEDKSVTSAIAEHIAGIITELGEDVNRQGLQRTPERVGEAFQYLTKGIKRTPMLFCVQLCLRTIIDTW